VANAASSPARHLPNCDRIDTPSAVTPVAENPTPPAGTSGSRALHLHLWGSARSPLGGPTVTG
jgi:hypothetical protein